MEELEPLQAVTVFGLLTDIVEDFVDEFRTLGVETLGELEVQMSSQYIDDPRH